MKQIYKEWIEANNLDQPDNAMGRCIEVTLLMVSTFPELIIKKGVVWSQDNADNYIDNCKEYTHAWCETKEGEIIDPTNSQYILLGKLEYKELDVTRPIFKCMGCGKYEYGMSAYCNKCAEVYSFS